MGVADQYKRFTLRIPEELHEKLLTIARRHHRSMNSEVIEILSRYCEEEEKKLAQTSEKS